MFGFLIIPATIESVLVFAVSKLKHLDTPQLEAETLLAYVLNKKRAFLKTHPEYKIPLKRRLLYVRYISKRAKHWPIAYITEQTEWADLNLKINKHVLIPRDETEILWEHIRTTKRKNELKTFLDIGTGSGCLAIRAAKDFPKSQVTALDISLQALKLAKQNAKDHRTEITFKHSDLLDAIPAKSHFNIITANLPYLPNNEKLSLEVQKEPSLALFSDFDGLGHIRALNSQLRIKKIIFNELWLEFLPSQAEKIKQIFSNYSVELKTDVGGDCFFAKICQKNKK